MESGCEITNAQTFEPTKHMQNPSPNAIPTLSSYIMISATTSIEFQFLMQIFLLMQINGTVGYNMLKSMLQYTEEEIQTGMSANFESAFHTCQLAYPLLKASGNGSIVNVSSLSGTVACWPGALYGGMQGMVEVVIITCSHVFVPSCMYLLTPGDKWVFHEFLDRMDDGG
jgi:hypothetical protein